MQEDEEGFLYPITNIEACTNCNACNRVCPILNTGRKIFSNLLSNTKAYAAAINDKTILLSSSSGGIFTAIATIILNKGGIVYGAAWENGEVHHIAVDNIEDLARLRGSKYVQSCLDELFLSIRTQLQTNRNVLFTGTPCQIAGLRAFLRKEYDNLLAVEIACHGAPSPKVLRKYLQTLRKKYGNNIQLDFRSKRDGWRSYKVTAYTNNVHYFYEGQKKNLFMRGFLHELYSRPICHECPFKSGVSKADITLADFWGIEQVLPTFPSYNGVSLVLTHTTKGESVFKNLRGLITKEIELQKALQLNRTLLHSEAPHPERSHFFKLIDKKGFETLVEQSLALRRITRVKLAILSYIKHIIKLEFKL